MHVRINIALLPRPTPGLCNQSGETTCGTKAQQRKRKELFWFAICCDYLSLLACMQPLQEDSYLGFK